MIMIFNLNISVHCVNTWNVFLNFFERPLKCYWKTALGNLASTQSLFCRGWWSSKKRNMEPTKSGADLKGMSQFAFKQYKPIPRFIYTSSLCRKSQAGAGASGGGAAVLHQHAGPGLLQPPRARHRSTPHPRLPLVHVQWHAELPRRDGQRLLWTT